MIWQKIIFLILTLGWIFRARADETLGRIELSDFLVEPQYYYDQNHRGGFQSGNSYIAGRWIRDELISGQIMLGTRALLGEPIRYGEVNEEELAIVEAYAQIDGSLGRLRAGLVQIPFGAEGGIQEGRLHFPRSLIFKEGIMGLRDLGVNYFIQNDDFFSEWTIHNGEGGRDLDNQIWFTARVGYQLSALIRMGFSGQVGNTEPASTNPNRTTTPPLTADVALMDMTDRSRARLGNVFAVYEGPKLGATLEATYGDFEQPKKDANFLAAHADLYAPINPIFAGLARFDALNSNQSGQSIVREATLGLSYRTGYETSEVFLYATEAFHPGVSRPSQEALLVWRLTPLITYRR